jgi:hypothetical protein
LDDRIVILLSHPTAFPGPITLVSFHSAGAGIYNPMKAKTKDRSGYIHIILYIYNTLYCYLILFKD